MLLYLSINSTTLIYSPMITQFFLLISKVHAVHDDITYLSIDLKVVRKSE